MITVTFSGPRRSGKSTAIKHAMAYLKAQGFACVNCDGKKVSIPKTFTGIVIRSELSGGPLVFEVSPNAPAEISVWAEQAVHDAEEHLFNAEEARINKASEEKRRQEALPSPGYLIWNPDGPHRPGVSHANFHKAFVEAERLANEHPDQSFFIMAPVSAFRAERVVRPAKNHDVKPAPVGFDLDDEIPF